MNLPEEIHGVSQSQFSIARHYGRITFNGAHYTYDAERDVLIRDDVLAKRIAKNKSQAKALADAERKKWTQSQNSFPW